MRHSVTGQWKLGFALALLAALLWGSLPVVLKLLLQSLDGYTITWSRFLAAALLLGAFQARRRALPTLKALNVNGWLLLAVAILGVTGNYVLFIFGLDFITASAAQVVIQLSPMLLLLAGLVFFGERFGPWQWAGLGILGIGLSLFFNHRLQEMLGPFGDYSLGVLLIVASSFTWTAYAVAQKQLLNAMASENIMLLIYVAGALLFLPVASPDSLAGLDGVTLGLLAFASLNTIFAYGAFAEALDHWHASRVGAVLSITPLVTLGLVSLLSPLTENLVAEPLNALSIIGALLVVCGSIMCALAGKRGLSPASVRASLE